MMSLTHFLSPSLPPCFPPLRTFLFLCLPPSLPRYFPPLSPLPPSLPPSVNCPQWQGETEKGARTTERRGAERSGKGATLAGKAPWPAGIERVSTNLKLGIPIGYSSHGNLVYTCTSAFGHSVIAVDPASLSPIVIHVGTMYTI